jgi:hypothetical protein
VLPFQLSNFLTSHAALHTWNGLPASSWDWCLAIDAKNASSAWLSGASILDMALQVFFNALLYEIHGISH